MAKISSGQLRWRGDVLQRPDFESMKRKFLVREACRLLAMALGEGVVSAHGTDCPGISRLEVLMVAGRCAIPSVGHGEYLPVTIIRTSNLDR